MVKICPDLSGATVGTDGYGFTHNRAIMSSSKQRSSISGTGVWPVAQEEVQYEAQIGHLRHSRFLALREDKNARDVGRER